MSVITNAGECNEKSVKIYFRNEGTQVEIYRDSFESLSLNYEWSLQIVDLHCGCEMKMEFCLLLLVCSFMLAARTDKRDGNYYITWNESKVNEFGDICVRYTNVNVLRGEM